MCMAMKLEERTVIQYKEKISKHLLSMWHWYLVVPVLVVGFWIFVFGLLDKIPYDEQLNIFVAAYDVQATKMEEMLYEDMKVHEIRQVNVDSCVPVKAEVFEQILSTRGTVGTDILILPDGTWTEAFLKEKILAFSEDDVKEYLKEGPYEYLKYDGKIYGIRIYDAKTQNTMFFDDLVNYEKDGEMRDYYLLFNIQSENIGNLGNESKENDNQALLLLQELCESGK